VADKKSKAFGGDRWGDIKAVSVDPTKIKFASRPKTVKSKKK